MTELMLFPLSSTVLPEGKMKLRIFEPRYQRMVRECCQYDKSFGMCLIDTDPHSKERVLSTFGTQVRIVDFDLLPDGMLSVTVVGEQRFAIQRVRTESDGLRIATVELLPNWRSEPLALQDSMLSHQLQQVYGQFPIIAELYPHCFFDDATWVAQRWLEILPLSCPLYEALMSGSDCHQAVAFLKETIEAPSESRVAN